MTQPPAIHFSHAGLYVRDMAVMRDFYTRVLGLVVTDSGIRGGIELVFMSRDAGEHHQLVLVTGRDGDARILNQLSFRLDTLGDLRTIRDLIAAEPYEAHINPIEHGIAWSIYCADPEGNRLELFVDTPWHVEQPIAEPFDLDQPDDALIHATELRYKDRPSFQPRAGWHAELRDKLCQD